MPQKVIVEGKEYLLDQQTLSAMEYFEEANAIATDSANPHFELTNIDDKTWNEVLNLCKIVNNKFPEVAKVKTSDPAEVVGKQLAQALRNKSPQEINKIYRAAQNLIIKNLRRCIAAVLACKVYIKPSLDEYNKKSVELGIKEKLKAEQSKMMKLNFTFMN